MQAAAARGADAMGSARRRTSAFALACLNADGGFRGRDTLSDLYYTAFGLSCLHALKAPVPESSVAGYLRQFGDGKGLDLVHAACCARCWALLAGLDPEPSVRDGLADRIRRCRRTTGGYETAYESFLALGALQDLRLEIDDAHAMVRRLDELRSEDGGYANHPLLPQPTTPSTAAAVVARHQLTDRVDEPAVRWLTRQCLPKGGFLATAGAGGPDLLSTAVALHAMGVENGDISAVRGPCRRFVRNLACNHGGYRAYPTDPDADCEYTFYALLALGHL